MNKIAELGFATGFVAGIAAVAEKPLNWATIESELNKRLNLTTVEEIEEIVQNFTCLTELQLRKLLPPNIEQEGDE